MLHLYQSQTAQWTWSLLWIVFWDKPSVAFSFVWVSFGDWPLSKSIPLFFQSRFFIFILVYWVFYWSKLRDLQLYYLFGSVKADVYVSCFFSQTRRFIHTAPSFLGESLFLRFVWLYCFINYIHELSHGSYTSLQLLSFSPFTFAYYSQFLQLRS